MSCPVDLYRFSPGGSAVAVNCLVKVSPVRSIPQVLTEAARFMASPEAKDKFKEYHTRFQRRLFKERIQNVASGLL